jgi:WD40 repeat protein
MAEAHLSMSRAGALPPYEVPSLLSNYWAHANLTRASSENLDLVHDASQSVVSYTSAIKRLLLQTYIPSLVPCPKQNVVGDLYEDGYLEGIRIVQPLGAQWDACQQEFESYSDHVDSDISLSDPTRIASASEDHTIKIWDVSSGLCLKTLNDHDSAVNSVVFSRDSARLASASDDSKVKIWDTSSGVCLQTLEGHSNVVWSVVFSHDSTRLASASNDCKVKLWDADSGLCLKTLDGHDGVVNSVVFSHDSASLASASDDGKIKIWDAISLQSSTLAGCWSTLPGLEVASSTLCSRARMP